MNIKGDCLKMVKVLVTKNEFKNKKYLLLEQEALLVTTYAQNCLDNGANVKQCSLQLKK